MSSEQGWFESELATLRTWRDELRVQANLAGKEARDRFEQAEQTWRHLEGRLRRVSSESRDSLDRVGEAARGLAKEIRDAYQHIRSLL
jgi:hypothetical protein